MRQYVIDTLDQSRATVAPDAALQRNLSLAQGVDTAVHGPTRHTGPTQHTGPTRHTDRPDTRSDPTH